MVNREICIRKKQVLIDWIWSKKFSIQHVEDEDSAATDKLFRCNMIVESVAGTSNATFLLPTFSYYHGTYQYATF
jgi:hypothetical protein